MKSILKAASSISDNIDRPKYCVYCGNLATQEAFFDVGSGVVAVEKYCHICNGRANLRLGDSGDHHSMMNFLKKNPLTRIII
jgi:hypothetical protein